MFVRQMPCAEARCATSAGWLPDGGSNFAAYIAANTPSHVINAAMASVQARRVGVIGTAMAILRHADAVRDAVLDDAARVICSLLGASRGRCASADQPSAAHRGLRGGSM